MEEDSHPASQTQGTSAAPTTATRDDPASLPNIAGPSITLRAHGITTSHGGFVQAGRDATVVQHHYHNYPEPKIDIHFLLRLVRNLRQIQQDNLSKATPGTGVWFFKTKKFILWLDLNGSLKILWGTGIPGTGKTVLASIVVNELEARAAAANGRICVGYIYFRYTDGADLTSRDVLEILVKQIVERHEDCISVAEEAYSRHVREGTRPTESELLQLLSRFTEAKLATFYILDALDEAPVRLQVDIVQKLASLNVRLFITSRPLKAVEVRVPDVHGFKITAHEGDLDLHISQEISRSRDLQDLLERAGPSVRDEIISSIKKNCGGMFLHASLQLNEICYCASSHEVMEALNGFPSAIEDVYLRTWNRILQQRASHVSTAKVVFRWVLYAVRPMTVDEVERAVATCPVTYKFEAGRMISRDTLMTICCGLVTIEDDSRLVRLIHYTAKEMLHKLLNETLPHPHPFFAAVCMTHLTQCEFQNTRIRSKREFSAALQRDPLLAYAFDAWAAHSRKSLGVAESRRYTATFVSRCEAFPFFVGLHRGVSFDTLGPLHVLAHNNLPLNLIPIDEMGNPNIKTPGEKATPLILASWSGNEDMFRDLLNLTEIQVNLRDKDGDSALMCAASEGFEGVVILLLGRPEIKVNSVDADGWSALMSAAHNGHNGIVKLLVERSDIKINLVDADGCSALMKAADGGHEAIFNSLLDHPEILINTTDNKGRSALMIAARNGHQGIVKILLAHPKIEVNSVDRNGWSALAKALYRGHNGVANLLLGHPGV